MDDPEFPFHIFTLLTNEGQYETMLESLREAGFDESNTKVTSLDNREGNRHEPYSAINEALRHSSSPYVLFCHQDLIFRTGFGPHELKAVLAELEEFDPTWAIAGNAGGTPGFRFVYALDDHNGPLYQGSKPGKVLTLDENFLVIRRNAGIGCTPDLSGFHLYATDLCLNAYRAGRSAYVIDFHLTHTGSSLDYEALGRSADQFGKFWGEWIRATVLITPATVLLIVRNRVLHRLADRFSLVRRLYGRTRVLRLLAGVLSPWTPDWIPRE